MIDFQNVSFSYGEESSGGGIRNVNLTINTGEFVLLTGESGCGKTTITRLVNGLVPHYYEGNLAGDVLLDGKSVSDTPLYDLAAMVGSVFQNPKSQFFNVDTDSELAFACENLGYPQEDILKRIQEGGVVGQGGAGFPTHVKLSPKEPDKIDYILVNGAECEPYITSDYRRMMEEPESIVGGLEVILKAFPKAVGCICIEDNKPDCIARMKEAIKGKERMEVKELKTKYPQGGERTLIYAVTGREINSTMLPADVGCVVDNVETVTSVYKAVILGQPVISRNVTVTGDGIRTPKNFSVLTGTDLSELVDAAGGLKEKIAKAISGGPMMGFALYDLHIPCTKTTSSLLFLERDAVSEAKQIQTACINCGRCVSVCPGHVVPARLATLAEHGDMAGFEKMDGMECCECGCCSYICPAKRPLTQSIKSMRKMVLAERKKKK